MKNFTKQNFKTNPLWVRLIIMAFMLLAGAGNVWAGMWVNDSNGWNIQIEKNGSTDWLSSGGFNREDKNGSYKDYTSTELKSFSIKKAWIKASSNDNWQIRYAAIYCRVSKNQTGNFTQKKCKDYGSNVSNANSAYFELDVNYDILNGLEPGTYYLDYYFGVGNDGCDKPYCYAPEYNCSGTSPYCSNCQNCSFYTIKFTVPQPDACVGDRYIAGSSSVFGSSWDAGDSNNKMLCDNTTGYSKTYITNFKSDTDIEFKITDGTWDNSWGNNGSNYNYNVKQGCRSVTIKFNGITGEISVEEEASNACCTKPSAPTIEINNDTSATLCSGSATITTTEVTGATSYSLYKGSATTASQTNTTGTFTVSEADTYYVTVTTCAESPKQTTGVTLSYYSAPTLTDKYSVTNATKCNNTPNNDGAISIQNRVLGVTYSLNDDEGTSWSDLAKGTYTLKATLDACNNLSVTETVEVGETDKTPAINDISIKEVSAVCKGEDLTLQLNEAVQDGVTYTWYKSNTSSSSIGTGTSLALTDLQETSTYILVASKTENSCTATKEASIEVTVNAIPTAPFGGAAQSETICAGDYTFSSDYIWYTSTDGNGTVSGSTNLSETTTYYISKKVINCESARTAYTVNVDQPLVAPTLTYTNPTTCNGNPTAGSIVIENYANYSNDISFVLYKGENPTEITYNNGFAISEEGSYKVVMTTSASNACGRSVETNPTSVTIQNNTPAATVSITGDASFCEGGNTVLTCNVTEKKGNVTDYQWYNGEEPIQGATASTYTANAAGSYKVVVTVNNNDCVDTFEATKEVSVKNKPTTPAFNPNFTSICVGGSTTLASGYSWYTDLNASALVDLTVYPRTTTTYYATKVENGCTSDAGTFTVKVNPLPEITDISVNNSTPVINEDVLLTVEGSDIETVEWSITSGNNASLSDASGNSVKLTSTASGAVTVTATAISSNGCRATSTKEVTFSETEDCEDDNVEIWLSSSLNTTMYLHRWYKNGNNDTNITTWPGAEATKSDGYYKWVTTSSGNIGYIFHDNTDNNKSSDANKTLEKGYRYYFTFDGGKSAATFNKLERIVPVTAPAVKTVSATSEEGSGVVTFTGKVLKTGCATGSAIWVGYQYKKANEAWPTTGVTAGSGEKQLVTITNNPGSEDFTANVEGLEDGDYHFRAYIINGYNFTNGNYDQGVYYGLDKLVTVSTVKVPVRSARIELTALDGTPVEEVCIGSTAYIKVTSDVKYTTATWKSDLGVEIVPTRTTNIYQFIVKGNDEIVVLLSNKHNDEPVSSDPISVEVYASASVPEIALGASSICDTNEDGTTLTVTRTKAGQYYALYKEDGNGGTLVEDYQLCSTDNAEIEFTGLKEAAKYFVKTYTSECPSAISVTSSTTLTVVDSKDVKISIEPITTETTPWMPAKLTVTATSDYTVTSVPDDAVINISGNTVKVKLPLPEGANHVGTTDNNVNVTFAPVDYKITAALKTTDGEENPCAKPTTATVTLKQYTEVCQ